MPCRFEEIQKQIAKLEKRHAVHIASYGEGNERRLTGKHETSSMHDFRCGHEWHAPCSYMPANLQEVLRSICRLALEAIAMLCFCKTQVHKIQHRS